MVRKSHYESAEYVTDEVQSTPNNTELCHIDYVREDGIGIRTGDGEKTHIQWSVATTRYTPTTVR